MSSIEEKLWDYIDGTCSADTYKAINQLIEQDAAVRAKYLELLALNREIAAMELDEPSMAFTFKVLETIRTEQAPQPLKATVNKVIIKVIGGFFVISITALLVFMFMSINWSAGSAPVVPAVSLPDVKNFFNGAVLKGFLFFDVILALFLFDSILRKRVVSRQ